jgi:hypothetical protein
LLKEKVEKILVPLLEKILVPLLAKERLGEVLPNASS